MLNMYALCIYEVDNILYFKTKDLESEKFILEK